MSIEISPETEARLRATARAEGISVEAFLTRLIDEREALIEIIENGEAPGAPLSVGENRAKIERGFLQSEHGDVADGDAFIRELLSEMDDIERKRRAG